MGRVIGADGGVGNAVSDFVKNAGAGGAGGIFAEDEEFGFRFCIGRGFGGLIGSGLGGAAGDGGVGFAELFEEAECALEGAFGGGSVAQEKIVLLDVFGGPIGGREAWFGAFMTV